MNKEKAVILIAHGSRRQQTEEEMAVLTSSLQAESSDILIESAYMELQSPTLQETISKISSKGISQIEILPLFFFTGKHMKQDIPEQVEECRSEFQNCTIKLLPCIGKSPSFIKALKDSI